MNTGALGTRFSPPLHPLPAFFSSDCTVLSHFLLFKRHLFTSAQPGCPCWPLTPASSQTSGPLPQGLLVSQGFAEGKTQK